MLGRKRQRQVAQPLIKCTVIATTVDDHRIAFVITQLSQHVLHLGGGRCFFRISTESSQCTVIVQHDESMFAGIVLLLDVREYFLRDIFLHERFIALNNFFPRIYKVACPFLNALLTNNVLHVLQSFFLLLFRHFQRLADGHANLVGIIRVDLDGIRKLRRRTGHLAQYQYTKVIVFRSDILLSHQIHTITQRSDQSDISQLVHRHQIFERKRVIVITYWCPTDACIFAIDGTNALIDAPFHLSITAHFVARGHNNHGQRHLILILRMLFQERFKAHQPMQDALTVIQSVYG